MGNDTQTIVDGNAGLLSDLSGTDGLAEASPRAVCSALNRLLVAGRSEIMVLAAAAHVVNGAERRTRLRAQLERRVTFRGDLMAAVTAQGGVPATHAASGARLSAAARRIRHLLIGPHEGDAYAACARATARTAEVYAKALTRWLPPDVRYGIERQYSEVEWDRGELRRMRWGAEPTPLPSRGVPERAAAEAAHASRRNEVDDALALEVWSDEGGTSSGRSSGRVTSHVD